LDFLVIKKASGKRLKGGKHARKSKAFRGGSQWLENEFFRHQEALVRFDIPAARDILKRYDKEIRRHILLEEEWLLPLYEVRVQGGPGGDVLEFTGEHSRILLFLVKLEDKLAKIKSPAESPREFINLLEDETHFKQMVIRHEEREEKFLFPELDRMTSENEKKDLLVKMGSR
jgi:hemerythrin-like domain-containing protein